MYNISLCIYTMYIIYIYIYHIVLYIYAIYIYIYAIYIYAIYIYIYAICIYAIYVLPDDISETRSVLCVCHSKVIF